MLRTALLLFFATAVAAPVPASAAGLFADPARTVEWRKPVFYTTGGLAVQWAVLVASGEADSSPSFDNFKDAWRSGPEPDDDSAVYNLVLHPLWGSETYLRAREANMGIAGSFGFSLGASITWEYLFESWTEHPSRQDLVLTTGIGWLIGELRFRLKQVIDEDVHWLIDPIDEGLEYVGIFVDDQYRPRVVFSRSF
jgi:hypothetical protein